MRNSKIKIKRNLTIPGDAMSQEEFVGLIKEAEKGPFYELGTFDNFKERVLAEWKKRHKK